MDYSESRQFVGEPPHKEAAQPPHAVVEHNSNHHFIFSNSYFFYLFEFFYYFILFYFYYYFFIFLLFYYFLFFSFLCFVCVLFAATTAMCSRCHHLQFKSSPAQSPFSSTSNHSLTWLQFHNRFHPAALPPILLSKAQSHHVILPRFQLCVGFPLPSPFSQLNSFPPAI